jgi:DNA-binding MarR family transcriptional regulator
MKMSNNFSNKDISQISTYQSGLAQATAHRITSRIVSDYLTRYDMTAMQWFIIGYIYDAGSDGETITSLSYALGTTLPYTTNTINLLESKGFIVKKAHHDDNRTKVITLNPAIKPMVEEIESGLREEFRHKLYDVDHITRDELTSYIKVIYKIIESDASN